MSAIAIAQLIIFCLSEAPVVVADLEQLWQMLGHLIRGEQPLQSHLDVAAAVAERRAALEDMNSQK